MSTPARYRKKPVVVEALQWLGRDEDRLPMRTFLNGGESGGVLHVPGSRGGDLLIPTLEGDMLALPGDWIIRGTAGEFYPCKPDVFAAVYEPEESAMTTLNVPDSPKMLRETLCVAQGLIGRGALDRDRAEADMARLQRLIDECDRHRPLGPDGKHSDRHTPTCGCEDR